MATIRIVDDWLRSPASAPSHYRSVMVIAEKWAEQRVLMRAYAESRDQTLPTITLHGIELAIGPAGLDINGSWGVHVGDPENGRAPDRRLEGQPAAPRRRGAHVRTRADGKLGARRAAHPAQAAGGARARA